MSKKDSIKQFKMSTLETIKKRTSWNKGLLGYGKGRKLSEESKKKISLKLKNNKNGLGHKISNENREKMLKNIKGKPLSEEHKMKISLTAKGKKKPPRSQEHLDKLRKVQLERVRLGIHHFWKGGITPENQKIRNSVEYQLWRKSVFERDRWTCIWCGYKGSKIEADHIKRFSDFPELRFAIDNGRTLCKTCHMKTHNWGN